MMLEAKKDGLYVEAEAWEAICAGCKIAESDGWYYCEQDKKLYCKRCACSKGNNSCVNKWDHQDCVVRGIVLK